jgi:hypothetical protein
MLRRKKGYFDYHFFLFFIVFNDTFSSQNEVQLSDIKLEDKNGE